MAGRLAACRSSRVEAGAPDFAGRLGMRGWHAGIVASSRVSTVFVGRGAEIETLAGAFDEAAGGTPGTVLVGAESGGGKSRLVAEFTSRVRDRALVLAGGCVDLGPAGLPYAPFSAALRELIRERGLAEVAALLPGNGPGELARLLPELGRPAADGDPEMARGRPFGPLLTLLEQLACERPLVLVIEDVHWADRSTGDLLAFLVRNLRYGPVVLVVTFRSDELDAARGLARLLAELGRMNGVGAAARGGGRRAGCRPRWLRVPARTVPRGTAGGSAAG